MGAQLWPLYRHTTSGKCLVCFENDPLEAPCRHLELALEPGAQLVLDSKLGVIIELNFQINFVIYGI